MRVKSEEVLKIRSAKLNIRKHVDWRGGSLLKKAPSCTKEIQPPSWLFEQEIVFKSAGV